MFKAVGLRRTLSRVLRWAAPRGSLRHRLLRALGQALLTRLLRGRNLDVYHPHALANVFRKYGASPLTWSPQDAETDAIGAARFILGLLQVRPDLRRQFPRALLDGPASEYCRWLCSAGAGEFGLSSHAADNIRAAFAQPPGERIRQLYDHLPQLRQDIPLALTPAGQVQFLRWLLLKGVPEHRLLPEAIWWFLLECAEDPHRGVAATYLRTPAWQKRFPYGLTVFGQGALLAWIGKHYRIKEAWLKTVDLSGIVSPVDEVRLLYTATPALQFVAPRAFDDEQDTRRLLRWLRAEGGTPATLDDGWWARLDEGISEGLWRRPGVNILGRFCYPCGLREAAHSAAGALCAAGVRTSCRDVPATLASDLPERPDYLGLELFDTTLIYLAPADNVAQAYATAGLAPLKGTYRIGVWYWELETLPPEWVRHASSLQEIWAPTRFIAQAARAALPIPVVDMLPGVSLAEFAPLPRSHFGLPGDRFLFLFLFDMCSVMERKNPLALIRAFRQAFPANESVALAIKVSRGDSDRESLDQLTRAAQEAGVVVIDRVMSRAESYALMNTCDCYVSLHRSEGFGLTMAEAMLLGKPVIATAYSGNLDFMSPDVSLLVDYRRTSLARDFPPYRKGGVWAEPALDHAAAHLRWVFRHPDQARALGARAREETARLLSPEAAGRRMARRLQTIREGRRGGRGRGEAA